MLRVKKFFAFIFASLLKFSSRRLNDGGSCCEQKFLKERLHTDILDRVQGVACKPRNGLGQYPIDFPLAAVVDHPQEVLPLIDLGPCQALVRIDIGEHPSGLPADQIRIVLDLGSVGVELIGLIARDPAVGGDTHELLSLPSLRNDGDFWRLCHEVPLLFLYFCLLATQPIPREFEHVQRLCAKLSLQTQTGHSGGQRGFVIFGGDPADPFKGVWIDEAHPEQPAQKTNLPI